LCVFDYGKDYIKALRYRNAEVPFVIQNDPSVAEAVERWTDPDYIHKLFTLKTKSSSSLPSHRTEMSDSFRFLYWRPDIRQVQQQHLHQPEFVIPPDWIEPTKLIRMTYDDWYEAAKKKQHQQQQQETEVIDDQTIPHAADENSNNNNKTTPTTRRYNYDGTDGPFYYYRLISCGESNPTGDCDSIPTSEYLFDEFPFFQPKPQQLYIVDPTQQKGIHCRFGMPGIVAENHFDSGRNAIVLLNGQRRYILSDPSQCPYLGLYPLGHPSARHSAFDWTVRNILDDTTTTTNNNKINEGVDQGIREKDTRLTSTTTTTNTTSNLTTTTTTATTTTLVGRRSMNRRNLLGKKTVSSSSSWRDNFPQFSHAMSNEVILQAGDVLYLPTHWFHFIVSLNINYQCNTRSGRSTHYDHPITACGFGSLSSSSSTSNRRPPKL
jgi:hypothetical protein